MRNKLRTCPYDGLVECDWIHITAFVADEILPSVIQLFETSRMRIVLVVVTYNRTTASIAYHEHVSDIKTSSPFAESCQRCCFWLGSKASVVGPAGRVVNILAFLAASSIICRA